MIIKEDTELGNKTEVRNPGGAIVAKLKEFDTITKRAIVYAQVIHNDNRRKVAILGENLTRGERTVVTFECHLLGYKAYNKETGKEII